MFRVLIVDQENASIEVLVSRLNCDGITCSVTTDKEKAGKQVADNPPDLLLMDIGDSPADSFAWDFTRKPGLSKRPLLLALITREGLTGLVSDTDIDDFVVKPFEPDELVARVKRLLKKINNIDSSEIIKCGDLIIDTASCEVSLSGRLIELTFREYELLRFLVANRGRVFSREVLLNRVWGYEYFGGDRTVDVHIRRLRSKIEDANHTFIDTIRNIGYRFKKNT